LDGELDLVRSLEFEEHLKSCEECARELREQRAMREALRGANLYQPSPQGLRAHIAAAIPSEMPGRAPRQAQASAQVMRRPALAWLATAAAIVIAVLLGARLISNVGNRQRNLMAEEIVASHIRSMQPGHLFDVESTDQHTVKPWFDGRIDFALPVADLASDGFPLVEGRLDYFDRRNVAALVYRRRKHIINVFIWPDQTEADQAAKTQRTETIQGYNLIFWSHAGMDFCGVSDLNVTEMNQLQGLLER
jgi:anti-sigma factor RsiW